MKVVALSFSIYILLFTLSCKEPSASVNSQKERQAALLESIKKFNTAFAEGNLAILDSMTTKNYVHTNGSSKAITKNEWFNYLNKRSLQLQSGGLKVLDYALQETQMEFHGNSAIVTGKVVVIAQDSLGTHHNQYRITNIWVYEKGGWKRAGFHDGKIK